LNCFPALFHRSSTVIGGHGEACQKFLIDVPRLFHGESPLPEGPFSRLLIKDDTCAFVAFGKCISDRFSIDFALCSWRTERTTLALVHGFTLLHLSICVFHGGAGRGKTPSCRRISPGSSLSNNSFYLHLIHASTCFAIQQYDTHGKAGSCPNIFYQDFLRCPG